MIHRLLSFTTLPLKTTMICSFSKKHDSKKKKHEHAKIHQPKREEDYIPGSEQFKKNVVELRNMQTPSETNIEQASLRVILQEQRQKLKDSFNEQLKNQQKKQAGETLRARILKKYLPMQQQKQYYLRRPLIYLQNTYITLLAANALVYSYLQIMQSYHSIGWYFGLFTSPAATSAIAILMGYNLAFWVIRHAFHLHTPTSLLSTAPISLLSSTPKHFLQLGILTAQYCGFIYLFLFSTDLMSYQIYASLGGLAIMSFTLGLKEVIGAVQVSMRPYLVDFARLVSAFSLTLLVYAFYSIQIKGGEDTSKSIQSESYRKRTEEIYKGYREFKESFKKQKFFMKENQKINLLQE